jgi:hypothetical protein
LAGNPFAPHMTDDQLLLEIEVVGVRAEWAMSEIEPSGGSSSLEMYLADLATEIVALLKLKTDTLELPESDCGGGGWTHHTLYGGPTRVKRLT